METYNQLISSINNFLKHHGYKKHGGNFVLKKESNRGIINFQKSMTSTANQILFTINVGVYLNSLSVFDNMDMLDKPLIGGCHWKDRINPISSLQQKEVWWCIKEDISFKDINNRVIVALKECALPKIEELIIDENLENAWLSGTSGGLSQQGKLLYLVALSKKNNRENWQIQLEQLKKYSSGRSFENNIKENLAKLGLTL